MNIGFQLFQLQVIDSEVDAAKKRMTDIDLLVANHSSVFNANSVIESKEEIVKHVKRSFNLLNDEVQAKKIKKTQSESNLYSGKVVNPKELQDIQQEIESLGKTISKLEDDLLNLMISLEEAEIALEEAKTEYRKTLSDYETQKSLLIGEKTKLDSQIQNLQIKKNSLISQIDPSTLNVYNSLRESKNGIAVAHLQDDSCTSCGTYLTPSQCQQARSPNTLFFCPNCGRIVYGS